MGQIAKTGPLPKNPQTHREEAARDANGRKITVTDEKGSNLPMAVAAVVALVVVVAVVAVVFPGLFLLIPNRNSPQNPELQLATCHQYTSGCAESTCLPYSLRDVFQNSQTTAVEWHNAEHGITGLTHPDPGVRKCVAKSDACLNTESRLYTLMLIEALDDEDLEVRKSATKALTKVKLQNSKINNQGIGEALLKLLSSPNMEARLRALQFLAVLPFSGKITLDSILETPHSTKKENLEFIYSAAVKKDNSIGLFKPSIFIEKKDTVDLLAESIISRHESGETQIEVFTLFTLKQNPNLDVSELIKLLEYEQEAVRTAAAEVLKAIDSNHPESISKLTVLLESDVGEIRVLVAEIFLYSKHGKDLGLKQLLGIIVDPDNKLNFRAQKPLQQYIYTRPIKDRAALVSAYLEVLEPFIDFSKPLDGRALGIFDLVDIETEDKELDNKVTEIMIQLVGMGQASHYKCEHLSKRLSEDQLRTIDGRLSGFLENAHEAKVSRDIVRCWMEINPYSTALLKEVFNATRNYDLQYYNRLGHKITNDMSLRRFFLKIEKVFTPANFNNLSTEDRQFFLGDLFVNDAFKLLKRRYSSGLDETAFKVLRFIGSWFDHSILIPLIEFTINNDFFEVGGVSGYDLVKDLITFKTRNYDRPEDYSYSYNLFERLQQNDPTLLNFDDPILMKAKNRFCPDKNCYLQWSMALVRELGARITDELDTKNGKMLHSNPVAISEYLDEISPLIEASKPLPLRLRQIFHLANYKTGVDEIDKKILETLIKLSKSEYMLPQSRVPIEDSPMRGIRELVSTSELQLYEEKFARLLENAKNNVVRSNIATTWTTLNPLNDKPLEVIFELLWNEEITPKYDSSRLEHFYFGLELFLNPHSIKAFSKEQQKLFSRDFFVTNVLKIFTEHSNYKLREASFGILRFIGTSFDHSVLLSLMSSLDGSAESYSTVTTYRGLSVVPSLALMSDLISLTKGNHQLFGGKQTSTQQITKNIRDLKFDSQELMNAKNSYIEDYNNFSKCIEFARLLEKKIVAERTTL